MQTRISAETPSRDYPYVGKRGLYLLVRRSHRGEQLFKLSECLCYDSKNETRFARPPMRLTNLSRPAVAPVKPFLNPAGALALRASRSFVFAISALLLSPSSFFSASTIAASDEASCAERSVWCFASALLSIFSIFQGLCHIPPASCGLCQPTRRICRQLRQRHVPTACHIRRLAVLLRRFSL